MDNKRVTVDFGGGGFLLAIIFLILKLTHVIDWEWLWIFAPIWIPLGVAAAVLIIYFIVVLLIALVAVIRG